MGGLFFQIGALDVRADIFAAASLLAAAVLIPAVRASRIDPAITLTTE